ncbi:MAG: c-type cytochrome biogenesis protein CcsB [Actinobacteria bacterium]|nr:c-type cytochrome biogenesis protein CcsB [Actinomycetota bacterium]
MKLEGISLNIGLIIAIASFIFSIGQIIFSRLLFLKLKKSSIRKTLKLIQKNTAESVLSGITILSGIFIIISIIDRGIITGHGPFSNMYEFAVAFSWGILVMTVIFSFKYRSAAINAAGTIIASCLLLFSKSLPSKAAHLVPALQQSFLLTAHVVSAVAAYGAFTIGFIAAVFYVFQERKNLLWLPAAESLEKISYTTAIIGFLSMTIVIILGALWADISWGRYWSWDPKETASLVTWLIYAGYLHSRIIMHWRGKKTALFLIIGFAAVIFTFFGNYIFNGLHSYS